MLELPHSGVQFGLVGALAATVVQLVSLDHLCGRVTSGSVFFLDGTVPVGYLLIGWLSSPYGVAEAVLIGTGLGLIVTGVGWIGRKSAEEGLAEAMAG